MQHAVAKLQQVFACVQQPQCENIIDFFDFFIYTINLLVLCYFNLKYNIFYILCNTSYLKNSADVLQDSTSELP